MAVTHLFSLPTKRSKLCFYRARNNFNNKDIRHPAMLLYAYLREHRDAIDSCDADVQNALPRTLPGHAERLVVLIGHIKTEDRDEGLALIGQHTAQNCRSHRKD